MDSLSLFRNFCIYISHDQQDEELGTSALVQEKLLDDDPEDYEDEGDGDDDDDEIEDDDDVSTRNIGHDMAIDTLMGPIASGTRRRCGGK